MLINVKSISLKLPLTYNIYKMQTSKNSTSKNLHFLNDKCSPFSKQLQVKSSKNLNISLGANQSIHNFNPHIHQNKSLLEIKSDHYRSTKIKPRQDELFTQTEINKKFNTIAFENEKLKQENQYLRRQLQKIKRHKPESFNYNSKDKYRVISRQHSKERKSGDLRGTIKKQTQEIGDSKQLKIKLQILSKQCKMYEQIIDKMESTIRRLTDQNRLLQSKQKPQQRHSEKDIRKQQFEVLKEKVGMIMKEYSDLESKMHSNELEWVIWKEQWITQKNIYLNKIKQLELKLKEKKQSEE